MTRTRRHASGDRCAKSSAAKLLKQLLHGRLLLQCRLLLLLLLRLRCRRRRRERLLHLLQLRRHGAKELELLLQHGRTQLARHFRMLLRYHCRDSLRRADGR